jgi:hypothetical protein
MRSKIGRRKPVETRHTSVSVNGSAAVEATPVESEAPAQLVPYDDAVQEAKQILANESKGQWRLGQLADTVQPKYGEKTLARFAKEIGIAACTVERYRDVYRAWKQIADPGRQSLNYSVARALATHPLRGEIVSDRPGLTKREAEIITKEYHAGGSADGKPDDESGTEVGDTGRRWNPDRAWLRGLRHLANEVLGEAGIKDSKDPNLTPKLQLLAIDPELIEKLRKAAHAFVDLADFLEQVTAESEPHAAVSVSEAA